MPSASLLEDPIAAHPTSHPWQSSTTLSEAPGFHWMRKPMSCFSISGFERHETLYNFGRMLEFSKISRLALARSATI
jgi:hypothetical protein